MKKFSTILMIAVMGAALTGGAQETGQACKICVISDPHYFDSTLLIKDGPAFQTYLAYDRKMLKESHAITVSVIDSIIAEQPDIVLVPGDLTKDGEMICHQKMAAFFNQLELAGAKVFVTPGNHDINNPHAVAFDSAVVIPVPSVTPAGFMTIYNDFGFSEALMNDTASLSYLAEPLPGIQILSMDVCRYDSNYVNMYPETGGGFKPQVLQWVKDRISDAVAGNKIIIGMQHHNMLEHYPGQKNLFPEYVIDDWDAVSTELADLGLPVVFTGHYHAQDIIMKETPSGNVIYDVETGSTVTYPSPYRTMKLDTAGVLWVDGRRVEDINYNTGGITFQQYALNFIQTGLPPLVIYMLTQPPYSLDPATAAMVEPAITETFIAHYAGNEGDPSPGTQAIIDFLINSPYAMIGYTLLGIWNDAQPDDWYTALDTEDPDNGIILRLKAMLEGPFNGTDMNTTLNNNHLLPLAQPYNTQPWYYLGTEEVTSIPDSVVDWVLLELRDAPDASTAIQCTRILRKAGFILNDGRITDLDGERHIHVHADVIDKLFGIVSHRNHLDVMTAIDLKRNGNIYSADLSTDATAAFGGTLAQKELATGVWAMPAGDGNGDGNTGFPDKIDVWVPQSGNTGYYTGDFDLNGEVNNDDKVLFWTPNAGLGSQVP